MYRLLAQMEELLFPVQLIGILTRVHRHRHDHLLRLYHELLYDAVLYRRKTCKPVEHDHAVPHDTRSGQHIPEQVKRFLRRDVPLVDVVQKPLIQQMQILQLAGKRTSPGGIRTQFFNLLRAEAVLHKLGQCGFYLADIPGFSDITLHDTQIILNACRDTAQHQALTGVVEHGPVVAAHLLKDAVRQPAETEHVDIHDPLIRMLPDHLELCLHRKLIRHDDQIIHARVLPRFVDDTPVQLIALSRTRCTDVKP